MSHFDIKNLEIKLKELENQTMKTNFWQDVQNSNKVLIDIKKIKNKVINYSKIEKELTNLKELTELVELEPDNDIVKEIIKNTNKLEIDIQELEIQTLFTGKYDNNNAIITIHPGAGGTESQDWAEMLYRMYTRWADKHNFKVVELDYLEGEEAGIKSVTFEIIG